MPELRWTLLILGVIFVAVLAWWERRKPHQASRRTPHIGGESSRVSTTANTEPMWGSDIETANPRAVRDPTLLLPEIRVREPAPPRDLPVVEIPGDSLMALRIADRPDPVNEEFAAEEVDAKEPDPTEDAMDPIAMDEPLVGEVAEPTAGSGAGPLAARTGEPMTARSAEPLGARAAEPMTARSAEPLGARAAEPMTARSVEPLGARAAEPMTARSVEPLGARAAEPMIARSAEPLVAKGAVAAPASDNAPELPSPAIDIVRPILNWPPEAERKLVALRLVARPPDRFQGRLVRQALAAEGFVLGELDIFHKPDAENRVVLSAASLTKPGSFDLETMDTQRYVGLNLFAVLPGPKSPQRAFEDLLLTARMLNERLEGALQDERGGPLTPTRIQVIRDGLGVEARS